MAETEIVPGLKLHCDHEELWTAFGISEKRSEDLLRMVNRVITRNLHWARVFQELNQDSSITANEFVFLVFQAGITAGGLNDEQEELDSEKERVN